MPDQINPVSCRQIYHPFALGVKSSHTGVTVLHEPGVKDGAY